MALLTIRTIPDPVLRQKAHPIEAVDDRVRSLMKDMLETMYVDGIGLAANQVGVLERILVIDISESRDGSEAFMMANPEIVWKSDETFTYREGCLSVRPSPDDSTPDLFANVTRPRRIRVRYLDENNETKELDAEDLFSQCLQHEIDHLDGILFIDYLSPLKRNMIVRKIEKLRKQTDGKAM